MRYLPPELADLLLTIWELWIPIGMAWLLAGGLVGIFLGGWLTGSGTDLVWIGGCGVMFGAPWLADTLAALVRLLRR